MTKFEIEEEKEASYRKLVNAELMEQLKEQILHELIVRKRYRDSNYTARDLARDLKTNTRYISAAVRVHFHSNYTSLINKYRVEEAMSALTDSRYAHLNVEEIGEMVGFAHRQSFHTAFLKFAGITPKAFRMQFEQRMGLRPIAPNNKK
ncbi:MAG: helix-turn-helix domain-containing protein [Prevotella sp.]|nr:helix-turn-helix domain-containing protein [Prevotella sp.]